RNTRRVILQFGSLYLRGQRLKKDGEKQKLTKKIKVKNGVVGYKTTLNYFVGKQPNRARTNWLMQECWLESSGHNKTVDYVLCPQPQFWPTELDSRQPQRQDNEYQEPLQPQPLNTTIYQHQSQRHDIAYQEPPQPQPLDTIHYHQSHQVQFWQATIGSHQMQLHDIAYHEPQPPDTVQDQLPQFWAAPLDSYPPRCHDIQYSQPRPLDAIEYQYLYQSGPLTTYENVIEPCTQDKSNGDIKKVDHALKIHLTPRGIKREAEEEEDEKRRRKKKEGGVEASKEDLE
ncbi:hypothetical protein HID58_084394, partial [Brassica napus]